MPPQGLCASGVVQRPHLFSPSMNTTNTLKNGERLVITENGQRVSGQTHATAESAQQEAAARKKQLQEKAGAGPEPLVETRQQLFG